MGETGLGYKLVLLLILVGVGVMVGCGKSSGTSSVMADDFQAKLDAMRDVQPYDIPDHLMDSENTSPQEGDFDPNVYFNILTHLSMEPGYKLDYLYHHTSLGSHPELIGRSEATGKYSDYQSHLVLDGSPESYLEYTALTFMGDQFYLEWHANYNDETIIANQAGAEVVLGAADRAFGGDDALDDVRKAAQKLDFTPTVDIGETEVDVHFITFTKWGGFISYTLTIQRDFPHEMLDWDYETLIEYDCGVMF